MPDRIGKGTNLYFDLDDYTVIDLETTSKYVTDCEVIDMAAVRVRKGQITETFSTLVKPEHHIPSIVSRITGITDDMVEDAPSCRDALRKYLDFIGNDIVVGHNILSFDANILYDLSQKHFQIPFSNNMIDTLHYAKYRDMEPEDYKLTTISAYLGIPHPDAHRALGDCIANYHCYERMKQLPASDYRPQIQSKKERTYYGAKPSRSTQGVLDLLGLVQKITSDHALSDDEIELLSGWIDTHRDLAGNYPYDVIDKKLSEILEDKIITEVERAELLALLEEQSDPVKHCSVDADDIVFIGKRVCLTGEFDSGTRAEIEKRFTDICAEITKTVTSKTDFLIVGGAGSAAWSCGNYGSKVKKALELQEKGSAIRILREETALRCLDYTRLSVVSDDQEICDFQMADYDFVIDKIQEIIEKTYKKYSLPQGVLSLVPNKGYHSVWIFEPVSKKKSSMIMSIRKRGKKDEKYIRFTLNKTNIHRPDIPDQTILRFDANDYDICYFDYFNIDEAVIAFLREIIFDKIKNFDPSDKFGCCGKYKECSRAGKCLHDNQFYAKACWYRKNLENGRVFY